jgi:hypothetical protein
MPSTELEAPSAAELELAKGSLAAVDTEKLVFPVVKLTQQLTKEVASGDVESGHFLNTLNDEDYGTSLDLIVCHYYKGRFYSPKGEDDTWVANGPVAPSGWPEKYANKPFADIPDAEENFRARVNAGEIPWGSGPPITTTHNYIGYVPENPDLPVRFSLMRSSAPAADKINTLLLFGGGTPWSKIIHLESQLKSDKQDRPYYVVRASQAGATDAEQRETAQKFARLAQERQSELPADATEEKPSKPSKPSAGLDVA